MVLQLFLGILAVVAFFLLVSRKRRRIWPLLMLSLLVVLGVLFFEHLRVVSGRTIAYQWLAYDGVDAQFIITSGSALNSALRLLLPLLAAFLWLNIVSRREDSPLAAGNIMLLSLASFIFMISSRDFMQLMAGSCCFSILGFYLINNTAVKNKFIFYNFAAEMFVFTALAVVYAKTGTMSLQAIGNYAQNGWHRDLVALLLLSGILIKCGMFLFQNQLLALQKLSFNRMLFGSLLVAPLSGMVLYAGLKPLLDSSGYTAPVLYGFLILSAFWGLGGMLWRDSLKAKILYFNMLFFAFSLFMISREADNLFRVVIILMPAVLLVDWCLMMVSVSASDEVYVSRMGGFAKCLMWNLLLTLAATAVFAAGVMSLGCAWPFMVYVSASLLGLAAVLHAVYLGVSRADEKVAALLCNAGWGYAWPVLAGVPVLAFVFSSAWNNRVLYVFLTAFGVLWLTLPQKIVNVLAGNEHLQEGDWLAEVYRLLVVSPLRLLGRILWLTVDFIVIERSVIGTLAAGMNVLEGALDRLQAASWRNYLLLAAVGLALLIFNIGIYAYE